MRMTITVVSAALAAALLAGCADDDDSSLSCDDAQCSDVCVSQGQGGGSCDGETCELSHDLALFLRDAGFVNTRVLVNGWTLWQQAGLPMEAGEPRTKR